MYISKVSKPQKFRGSENHSEQHLPDRKLNLFNEVYKEAKSRGGGRKKE